MSLDKKHISNLQFSFDKFAAFVRSHHYVLLPALSFRYTRQHFIKNLRW